MKAFTAFFAVGTIVGTALATPIGNAGDTAVKEGGSEADKAARQAVPPLIPGLGIIPGIPIFPTPAIPALPTPGLPTLTLPTLPAIPGLPSLLPIPVPTSPADLASALELAIQQILTVLALIRAGLPATPSLAPLPTLPSIPGLSLPLPTTISPTDLLTAEIAILQGQLTTIQTIFNNLPTGASVPQLGNALSVLGQIQAQVAPVVDRIRTLVNAGTFGLPPNLPTLESASALISTIYNVLTSLLDPLLGLGGGSDFGR